MPETHLRVERDPDGVGRIVLDRPEAKNALTVAMRDGVIEAVRSFRADPKVRAVLITGEGDSFCAGMDLSASTVTQAGQAGFVPRLTSEALRAGVQTFIRELWELDKPTIAAVNGVAYAGGLEWACWTDLCVADDHATFGVTCRRWNIGLGDGGTQRLPRIVGYRVAMDLILTGRVIGAHEAHRIGLVNEVVPRGTCLVRARELAHALATLPVPAMRTDKEAAARGWGRPLDEGLEIEAECFARLVGGAEMAEGLRQFNERDHPDRGDGPPSTPGLSRPHA